MADGADGEQQCHHRAGVRTGLRRGRLDRSPPANAAPPARASAATASTANAAVRSARSAASAAATAVVSAAATPVSHPAMREPTVRAAAPTAADATTVSPSAPSVDHSVGRDPARPARGERDPWRTASTAPGRGNVCDGADGRQTKSEQQAHGGDAGQAGAGRDEAEHERGGAAHEQARVRSAIARGYGVDGHDRRGRERRQCDRVNPRLRAPGVTQQPVHARSVRGHAGRATRPDVVEPGVREQRAPKQAPAWRRR